MQGQGQRRRTAAATAAAALVEAADDAELVVSLEGSRPVARHHCRTRDWVNPAQIKFIFALIFLCFSMF